MKTYIFLGIFPEHHMFVDVKERCHVLFAYDNVETAYNFLSFIRVCFLTDKC